MLGYFVFGFILIILGVGILFQYRKCVMLEEKIKRHEKAWERENNLFFLMHSWFQKQLLDKSISEYLQEKKYKTIAVYGMGKVGACLVHEVLIKKKINVVYAMDRDAKRISSIIPVYTLEQVLENFDKIPKVDAIILTTYCATDSLFNELKNSMSCEVLKLEEIINDL